MLQARGVIGNDDEQVTITLTRRELRGILTTLRARQDDINKVTPEYPREYYSQCRQLDVELERTKMHIVGQM